jgi:GNAT superfamily N-acetyltransferase
LDAGYAVRQATLDDIETIITHRRTMFYEMGVSDLEVRMQEERFRQWIVRHMQEGDYVGWFALAPDGQVAAGAGLWVHDWLPGPFAPDGVRGYVCNVYTEPAHRGHGLAHRLVQECVNECRRRRLTVVALHASSAGRPIYEEMGFADTSELRMYL